ncbi:MAG TPA: two-component regulator propeller domain-containing protein, partial [Thermoanaerobaculia bacterium]
MTPDRQAAMRAALLVLGVALALVPPLARGADGLQYTVDVWDASHGLPQSSVQAVAQSEAGYIWIGTMGGLARFDGLRFRVFDKRNTPLLHDNVIQALFCDGDRLWIGTGAGGVTTFEDGRFRRVPGFSSDVVWAIARGPAEEIWVATQKGLAAVRAGAIRRIAIPGAAAGEPFLSLCRDRNGAMWAGS